jgi:uncharacterized protein
LNFLKVILIFLGTVTLIIGVVGAFIPGLPTTPFLLLTAGLYLRSSDRLYHLLITNRLIGPYIQDFKRKKGMTKKSKIYAICTMWIMIAISSFGFIKSLQLRLIVLFIGLLGTFVMGVLIPTVYSSDSSNK